MTLIFSLKHSYKQLRFCLSVAISSTKEVSKLRFQIYPLVYNKAKYIKHTIKGNNINIEV